MFVNMKKNLSFDVRCPISIKCFSFKMNGLAASRHNKVTKKHFLCPKNELIKQCFEIDLVDSLAARHKFFGQPGFEALTPATAHI